MDAITSAEIKALRESTASTLAELQPKLDGLLLELKRMQTFAHDHEHFLIQEFRRLTRAIDGLNAQIARLEQL